MQRADRQALRREYHAAQSQCGGCSEDCRGRRSKSGNDWCWKPGKIHGTVEECRSESHSGGSQCGYGEDDGARRSGRCGGGRHGKRWTYRFHHDHGAGSAGSGCGIYPGDRSWRYRRWQRNGSGLHAGS